MNILLLVLLSACIVFSKGDQADTDYKLIRAALEDDPDPVKVLLEKGANINARDRGGITPLMNASNNGRYETAKVLIENGADVNAKDNEGVTPLMFASAFSNSETTKLLIESGSDVNAKDDDGWSALIFAAYNGRGRTVRLLLRKDADYDYALKYATEGHTLTNGYYHPKCTSDPCGYAQAIETINENNTFWQRLMSYLD